MGPRDGSQPLFWERDRKSMKFAFDLWSYQDVRSNAEAILDRVKAGTMPCDGHWPAEWVEVFERWTHNGMGEQSRQEDSQGLALAHGRRPRSRPAHS